MDPSLDVISGVLQFGVPGVLALGLVTIWREWQKDRRAYEQRTIEQIAEAKSDAAQMHKMADDLGKAADAVAQMNKNGVLLVGIDSKIDRMLGRQ